MLKSWRKLLSGFILAGLVSPAAAECPDLPALRHNLNRHEFLSVDFVQLTHSEIFAAVDTLRGSLRAGGQGKFRLDLPGQIIVSNGILYWSYSVENQQVLIDSVVKMGDWNPLTLLYDPENVYECRSQEKSPAAVLFKMAARDSLTVPHTFGLQVTDKNYTPEKLEYFDDNDSRIEVLLERFSGRANMPDSIFEFRPGPDVEVIMMP